MHNEYESALIHAIEVIHELMAENRRLRTGCRYPDPNYSIPTEEAHQK